MVLVYSTSFTEMKELLAGRVTPKNVYRRFGHHVRFHSICPRIEIALNALNLNLNLKMFFYDFSSHRSELES